MGRESFLRDMTGQEFFVGVGWDRSENPQERKGLKKCCLLLCYMFSLCICFDKLLCWFYVEVISFV